MKNGLVKDYLKNHKVLISYVRDKYGFRKGVVVAISKNQIGWSVVNPEDYVRYRGALTSIPAIARDIKWDIPISEITKYLTFEKGCCVIMQPSFDRNAGLYIALTRALQDDGTGDRLLGRDKDLIQAVKDMCERAERLL